MRTTVALAALGAALSAAPEEAGAQAPMPAARAQLGEAGGAHGRLLESLATRPLHVRVPLADGAAIGTIGEVGPGRIQVRAAVPIFGRVPEQFELKRAPSRPPKLAPGERCVLLLRGARSPYVLVDEPHEIERLVDASPEDRWRRELRRVRDARPHELVRIYADWLEQSDAPLKSSAVAGLSDARAPFRPLDAEREAEVSVWLAGAAADPALGNTTRLTAAMTALRSTEGQRALLSRLPGEGADAQVLAAALRVAAVRRSPELVPLARRSLSHPDPQIRRAAVSVRGLAADPEIGGEIERLATADPDPRVRSAAERALEAAARDGARREP